MTSRRPGRRLVPAYLATGGRATPRGAVLDRLAVLQAATTRTPPGMEPAPRRILELLQGGPLSLMEVAAHVGLPLAVTRVLVGDLLHAELLLARSPIPAAGRHDPQMLRKVLDGLRAIR